MSGVESKTITVQVGKALARIPLNRIRYLESRRHYVTLHVDCGIFTLRGKISYFERTLAADGFVRTHRCYVVNRASVVHVSAHEVKLVDGTPIPVGRRYRAAITAW